MAAHDTASVPAEEGTRPQLHRGLKVLGTLLITLSAITPASSVFIIAPGVVGQAGTGAFLAFVAAGVVGILMAFVYAELASAYPLSGGEYAIVARAVLWALGTTARAAYRMPWFPVAPVLALAALAYVIYENFQDPKVGRPSLYTTLGIAVAFGAYYLLVLRRRGTWELRGAADE